MTNLEKTLLSEIEEEKRLKEQIKLIEIEKFKAYRKEQVNSVTGYYFKFFVYVLFSIPYNWKWGWSFTWIVFFNPAIFFLYCVFAIMVLIRYLGGI